MKITDNTLTGQKSKKRPNRNIQSYEYLGFYENSEKIKGKDKKRNSLTTPSNKSSHFFENDHNINKAGVINESSSLHSLPNILLSRSSSSISSFSPSDSSDPSYSSDLSPINSISVAIHCGFGQDSFGDSPPLKCRQCENYINQASTCSICQENIKGQPLVELTCSHVFCNSCLSTYVQLKIEEGQVLLIACPTSNCQTEFTESIIKSLVSEAVFTKYLRFKKIEVLSTDPYIKWCPVRDCEGYDKGSLKQSKLTCNICSFEYCFYCSSEWHPKNKCKFEDEKQLDEWARQQGVKFCPNCRRKVEKNMGCDHMTCPKCNYQWCWLCGSQYSSVHYQSCEVKRMKKLNPPMLNVVCMIVSPLAIPFLSIIFFCFLTHKIKQREVGSQTLRSFVNRRPILSYFFSVILGIVLSPLFFVLAPITVSIVLLTENLRGRCCRGRCLCFNSVFFGILICPFLVIFFILATFVAHAVGFILLGWKLCIFAIRCKNPQFLSPGNYGYK